MPSGVYQRKPGKKSSAAKHANGSADKAKRLAQDALRWIRAGDYELARLMLRRVDEMLSPLTDK